MPRFTDLSARMTGWLGGGAQSRRVLAPSGGEPSSGTAPSNPAPADSDAAAAIGGSQQRSRLVAAFNAAHPIARRRELRGREEQLEALFDGVLRQRKHGIVHGARGSGKTSLVRVFADHADRSGVVLIYLACDARSSFVSMMRPFIRFVPASNIPAGQERAFRAEVKALGTSFGPRELVSLLLELAPKPIIFILDEFDRVTDPDVQDAIATTMKLLSDAKAPAQLLVVGIAQSVTELIEHHPSLRRHMTAVTVGRIADSEVDKLIEEGADRAGIAFDPAARRLLVSAAAGSPYHARLFAYHAGAAVLDETGDVVTAGIARAGLDRAISEWGRVNDADHGLFDLLVDRDPVVRDALTQVAIFATRNQGAVPEGGSATLDEAVRRLSPALERNGKRIVFRDSLAPQMLLAMLLNGEGADAIEEPVELAVRKVGSWT